MQLLSLAQHQSGTGPTCSDVQHPTRTFCSHRSQVYCRRRGIPLAPLSAAEACFSQQVARKLGMPPEGAEAPGYDMPLPVQRHVLMPPTAVATGPCALPWVASADAPAALVDESVRCYSRACMYARRARPLSGDSVTLLTGASGATASNSAHQHTAIALLSFDESLATFERSW